MPPSAETSLLPTDGFPSLPTSSFRSTTRSHFTSMASRSAPGTILETRIATASPSSMHVTSSQCRPGTMTRLSQATLPVFSPLSRSGTLMGFEETIVTDAQWHGVNGMPYGFEQVAFDDSQWPAAFVEGSYPNTAPWTQPEYAITIPPETQTPGSGPFPFLQNANWIWTNEIAAPGGPAPIGARAFRKAVVMPNGELAIQAKILIAADNEFTLYINGQLVGSGQSFTVAQRWVVNFPPTARVVIAVFGRNTGGPAGVIASVQLLSCVCGGDVRFVTDSSWKYFRGAPPAGFIDPGFDDSAWLAGVQQGTDGVAPWGPTTVPTNNSPQSAALNGAPDAPPASVVA